jgi:PadR family transcriptional regulator PadR
LSYRWQESPQGPPRKYYELTDKGREALELLDASWNSMVEQIDAIRNQK